MLETRWNVLVALALAGVLPLLAACMPTGGGEAKVVILYHDDFDGLPVEIDGRVVGSLKKFGENPRTAFLVSKGDHKIRVVHPTMASETVTVTAVSKVMPVTLLLEVGEAAGASGTLSSVLVLRH